MNNQDGVYEFCEASIRLMGRLSILTVAILLPLTACASSQTPTSDTNGDEANQEVTLVLPFQDDFSDEESGWRVSSKAFYTMGYQDGGYLMQINDANLLYSFRIRGSDLEDMILEVDAEMVAGGEDNGFGLICRLKEHGTSYLL